MSFPLATADKISCSLSVKCFELIDRQSKETQLRHKLNYIQSLKFGVKFDNDKDQLTIIFKSKPSNAGDSHLYLRFDLSLTLLLISKSIKPNSIKYPYNFPKVSMSINSENKHICFFNLFSIQNDIQSISTRSSNFYVST